jgi:two-component system, NtrC family, C4-dicarboxylate transport sensor histidine kinase DctB
MNRPSLSSILILAAALVVAVAASIWGGSRWASARASQSADIAAAQTAQVHQGLLASELQKFRLLPVVLAEYPDVSAVLETRNPEAEQRLDVQLEALAKRTDAAAIYLIDSGGTTRVASNWRQSTSFVGQNYGFRPYFRDAMKKGSSELFALGTVSGQPGLYLARRVDRGSRPLGAIIVKVDFAKVEENWARGPGISFVTDPHGVILITGVPGWRFGATSPLDSETLADARRSLQFGVEPPARIPLTLAGSTATVTTDGKAEKFRVAEVRTPLAGGRLYHLSPLGPPLAAARSEAMLWALAALLVVGSLAMLAFRQTEKQRLLREASAGLEREVARQTAQLRDANERLIVESQEREEAIARYNAAREDLARANRLGTLGQITAGVAHEINQPVAAIRTFAENGTALIDKDRADGARENLLRIVGLTERIGTITSELRSFTRRKTPTAVPAQLGSILDGALLLSGETGRSKVTIRANARQRTRVLAGDRVRVEQILINLLRNALDAVEQESDPQVTISAREESGRMHVSVADNGSGVDPAIRDTLFDPFETAKPGGLGLGLAIARDIAREFGGELILVRSKEPGATFRLTLPIAA